MESSVVNLKEGNEMMLDYFAMQCNENEENKYLSNSDVSYTIFN
jgi:hypothetical protein